MTPPAAIALCLLLCAGPLHAAPELPSGDAMLQRLPDRGVPPAAGRLDPGPLVQQVRGAASNLALSAMDFLGVPYRRGGNSAAQGFDCSGFTRHVFEQGAGLLLPRRADQQARDAALRKVPREQIEPGDLVFFNTLRRAFSHVGIYLGDGRFIHAPRSGSEVRVEDMRQAYWARRFNGARRAEVPAGAPPAPAASSGASPPL